MFNCVMSSREYFRPLMSFYDCRTLCLKLASCNQRKERMRGGLRALAEHMNHVTRWERDSVNIGATVTGTYTSLQVASNILRGPGKRYYPDKVGGDVASSELIILRGPVWISCCNPTDVRHWKRLLYFTPWLLLSILLISFENIQRIFQKAKYRAAVFTCWKADCWARQVWFLPV